MIADVNDPRQDLEFRQKWTLAFLDYFMEQQGYIRKEKYLKMKKEEGKSNEDDNERRDS